MKEEEETTHVITLDNKLETELNKFLKETAGIKFSITGRT